MTRIEQLRRYAGIGLTLAIIALTCVVSFVAFGRPALVQQLILWPPAIARRGEYWRLLSYGLIHADPGHLFFNMVTLYFFGRAMEPLFVGRLGPAGYLAFYLGALLVSILPTYLRNRNNANYHSLGASGAVSAVLFAFILLQPWALIFVFFIPVPAIVYAVLYVGYKFNDNWVMNSELEFEHASTGSGGSVSVEFNNRFAEDPHDLKLRHDGTTFAFPTVGSGDARTAAT